MLQPPHRSSADARQQRLSAQGDHLSENGHTAMRVLLIEDDPLTRELLASALIGTGYEVHIAPDGDSVESVTIRFRPDIALIDTRLGDGLDGLAMARRIRATDDIPLMFLTSADAVDDIVTAFDVGGNDYVVRPFVVAELLARIRSVLQRSGRRAGKRFEVGDLMFDLDAHSVVRGGSPLVLTHQEFLLLTCFCQHPGVVLSKSQLLSRVWGFEHCNLNVVEVHVSALRRKLEEHGPRLIHTIRGVGYALRP